MPLVAVKDSKKCFLTIENVMTLRADDTRRQFNLMDTFHPLSMFSLATLCPKFMLGVFGQLGESLVSRKFVYLFSYLVVVVSMVNHNEFFNEQFLNQVGQS